MKVAATSNQSLQDSDVNIRLQAAMDLGIAGDSEALIALVRALANETDFFVRESITWALLRIGNPAVAPLLELLGNSHPEVRLSAVHALGKIGDSQVVPTLLNILPHEVGPTRDRVLFVLGQLGDERALPALISLLGKEDEESSATLISAIEKFGIAAFDLLVARSKEVDWQVRAHVIDLLGFISDPVIVPHLSYALADEDVSVRIKVIAALASLLWDPKKNIAKGGSEEVVRQALLSALNDSDHRVRLYAERVLASSE